MLNKKKTLVIDSEAEEKAKAQAIKQELDDLKPKKQPKPQDTSKATNQKALTKIRKRTVKFAVFAALTLALILGLAWSINQKSKNEQAKQEQQEQTKKVAQIAQKASEFSFGVPTREDELACADKESTLVDEECLEQKTIANIDKLLTESLDDLSETDRNNLLSQKFHLIISKYYDAGDLDGVIKALDQILPELKKYDASYRLFGEAGSYYTNLGQDDKAIEAFKIAKAKHAKKLAEDPTYDLDVHSFPTTKEELEILRNLNFEYPEN